MTVYYSEMLVLSMANHKILVILALTSQESCDTVASETSFLFSARVIHTKLVGSLRKNAAAHRRGGRGRHMAYHASNGSVISTSSPSRWVPGAAMPSAVAPVLLPQAHSISSANMTKREVSFFVPVPPAYPIYPHYTVPPPF